MGTGWRIEPSPGLHLSNPEGGQMNAPAHGIDLSVVRPRTDGSDAHRARAENLRREIGAMRAKRCSIDEAIARRQHALSRLEARAALAAPAPARTRDE